jgi:SWI/SNF-related matrix-associated actin-dependent regulator of chromatin subfamily A-like protein 1
VPILKPHQITGAHWLASKRHALLADEMRVGKTLTALHAAHLIGAQRILIVCPAVARRVWAVGVSEALGRIATIVTTGGELLGAKKKSGAAVVVTSYGLMPDSEAAPWDLVIFDECHFLKSAGAGRAQRALGKTGLAHRAANVWLLSGTPAPSNAGEMWTMLHTFGIYAGTYEEFTREFCTGYVGAYGYVVTGSKNQDKLRALMKDFMLRRTLAEVAPDLAPIEFSDYPLDGVQVTLPPREVSLVGHALANQGAAGALETVEPTVATLRRLTGLAKIPAAAELLRGELEADTHKLVIFAVHREVVFRLREHLYDFGAVEIAGDTPAQLRNTHLLRFQTDPKCRVFIGNIQAAGTAIDLSVASECVFVESSWVPGDNTQAAMRLQNMNRTGTVTARFLSAGGTIDERIQRVLARKVSELAEIFS